MENIERLIRTWIVGSGRDEEIDTVASEITDGKANLLSVVKSLGEYLTSEDDEERRKGIVFLSSVISRCPQNVFNTRSTTVLVTFYCEKLSDSETIAPTLQGLLSLCALPSFLPANAQSTVHALFVHIQMKSLPQSARLQVLSIIDTLMARHREALKKINDEFLAGYISLVTGEKDPRNLLLTFAINRVAIIEFDLSKHTDAMFDVIFCYFPITFRPPPGDPSGITNEDLASALLKCLNATPDFGPLAIPVFIEKLNAGSPNTKKDTLVALASSLPVYGPALARASARKLWNSLKLEILQPTNQVTEIEALRATQVLITTIYSKDQGMADAEQVEIQGLAKDACEECLEILREPEKSMAKPAMKVLCGFMSTTVSIAQYTVSQTVPHLIKLFRSPEEVMAQPPILRLLSDLASAARDAAPGGAVPSTGSHAIAMSSYKDDVLAAAMFGLKKVVTRQAAVELLKALITTKGLCTDDEIGYIVLSVNEYLKPNPDESEDSSDAILDLLSKISASNPLPIKEQTLPLLFSELPDTADLFQTQAQRDRCRLALGALTQLCITSDLFETLVIRLLTKLDLICVRIDGAQAHFHGSSASYAYSLLATLAKVLEKKVESRHSDVAKYIDGVVWRLYNLFIFSAASEDVENRLASSDLRLVSVSAKIIGLVVQVSTLQQQETFVKALYDLYLNGNIATITTGQHRVPTDVSFTPFKSTSERQKNVIILFAAAVVALHKEIEPPVSQTSDLLITVTEWAQCQAEIKMQKEAAWHLVASIVNKHVDSAQPFLEVLLGRFWAEHIADSSKLTLKRTDGINACVWVAKALLVRNHQLLKKFTDRFLGTFNDKAISWEVAKGIGRFASANNVLTKSNHCITKILHVQKFFNEVFERLIQGATDSLNCQSEYLVTLTSLLNSVPKATYIDKLPTLMPLLLRSLQIPDSDVRADVTDTLLSIAEEDSVRQSAIAEHVSTLISSMLDNALSEEIKSARVKISALRYLGILPNLVRYDLLHPYKAIVLDGLGKALDDTRKTVRKEAVDARTNWFKCSG